MSDIEQRIREQAYRIWLDENRPEGRDKEHWDMAKEIVTSESDERPENSEPQSNREVRPSV